MKEKTKTWIDVITLMTIIIIIINIFFILDKNNIFAYDNFFQNIIYNSLIYLILMESTFIFILFKKSIKEIGFTKKHFLLTLGLGFICSLGMPIAECIFKMPLNYTLFEVFPLFIFLLIVGITEETIFRGYIQTRFDKIYKFNISMILTSVLFSSSHIPKYFYQIQTPIILIITIIIEMATITGFGCMFYLIRKYQQTLTGVIIFHTFWNFWNLLFLPDISNLSTMNQIQLIEILGYLISGPLISLGLIIVVILLSKKYINQNPVIASELNKIFKTKLNNIEKKFQKLLKFSEEYQLKNDPNFNKQLDLLEKYKNYILQFQQDIINIENAKKIKIKYKLIKKIYELLEKYIHLPAYKKKIFRNRIYFYAEKFYDLFHEKIPLLDVL